MSEEQKIINKMELLQRNCWSAASEVKSICELGRSAVSHSAQVNAFKGAFRSLEKYYSKFETIWEELTSLDLSLEKSRFPSDDDEKKRKAVRGYYYEVLTHYEAIISKDEISRAASNSTAINSSVINRIESTLQPIPLPNFNGQILEWPKFRDVFTSIIHNNEDIPVIKKFHYLAQSLSGPASTTISSFKMEERNYELAWQALRDAFENKRVLANCYLNKILMFKPLQKSSGESLRKFLTEISDNVSALKRLEIVDIGDFILFHLAIRNLDSRTREQFELAHKQVDFPKFDDLSKFVRDRLQALQLADVPGSFSFENQIEHTNKGGFKRTFINKSNVLVSHDNKSSQFSKAKVKSCFVCNGTPGHALKFCSKFKNAIAQQRIEWLRTWTGCQNCLSYSHRTSACPSTFTCRYCSLRHHSWLHPSETASPSAPIVLNSTTINESRVILGTAVAEIADVRGIFHRIRLVIDSGSQHCFITKRLLTQLGLPQSEFKRIISGIGDSPFTGAEGQVECVVRPQSNGSSSLRTSAVVVKEITNYLPNCHLPSHLYSRYLDFQLADPTFWKSSPIDFLLGAELFAEIWTGGIHEINEHCPKLFSSIFGNVVIGRFSSATFSPSPTTSLISTLKPVDLLQDLNKFWELEEPSVLTVSNPEDELCEVHFKNTHFRLPTGQYVVRLPFTKNPLPSLVTSAISSKKMFLNLETKLSRNPQLQAEYCKFMQEYIDLGHMKPASSPSSYVIPHHAVTKDENGKLKLRVVFNASASTSNGSLNDFLMTGPKLQTNISLILLNFRIHKFVFVADVVKMFRQIIVDSADRSFQHIYWRSNPSDPLLLYELNTVTYGTRSAPFQALRVIHQLKEDEGSKFPLAASILTSDVYVDDYLTGSDSESSALELQSQLVQIMEKGGLSLSKWSSNSKAILDNVSCISSKPVPFDREEVEPKIKILGLQWDPNNDSFSYKINVPPPVYTKRGILSTVAKVYDPLGFLTPSVLLMKNFIQDIWKEGLHWDQQISSSMQSEWDTLINELENLSLIRIPRFIGSSSSSEFQVVAYSDASTKGYCATLFLRTINSDGIKVHLLTAKSKLAPVRTVSVPRLELQGAFLLATLYKSISPFLERLSANLLPPVFFTDSSIVLGWLNTPAYKLKTYVANRVTDIIQLTSVSNWRHVNSSDNPSDVGSRGMLPSLLINNRLWWTGPAWLSLPQNQWPPSSFSLPDVLPESKSTSLLVSQHHLQPFIIQWMHQFSSFSKLMRVVAVIVRRINAGANVIPRHKTLTPADLKVAATSCIRILQAFYFIENSKDSQAKMNKLFGNLSPFQDGQGLWRVGGRLRHSSLHEDHKHPILLPPKSHFVTILVDHYHKILLHASPTVVQAIIQTRYWVPGLRRVVRKRTFMCIKCFKLNSKVTPPLMADLPSFRVHGKRAFGHVGVDFAGPFIMRDSLRRKAQTSKVYLCLFVCMETKALHLEAVTQLTTSAFMASFDRFTSRRGLPSDVYSDSGTNFVGASNRLKELYRWLQTTITQDEIRRHVLPKEIHWHFNPPHAPHFGGLWESGVRSVKRLMRVSAGDTPLTYEELSTLFARYEAILNSRPLCPVSSDPEDVDFLSPGHFLVGGNLLSYPEPSLLDLRENSLSRWQLVKRFSQQFWKRWHLEYLTTLQKKAKWTESHPNLQVGDLVILRDQSTPVMRWPVARVTDIHPGDDGVVRVVTVLTSSGQSFRRPTVQLIPLLPLSIPSYDSPDPDMKI